jgi:hypothetical protein
MIGGYGLLFLPALGWLLWRRFTTRGDALPAVAAFALITLFVGLRHGIGGDWHAYWLMLERSQSHGAATALLISDPAYMALNIAAGRLGLNLGAVNLVCAAFLAGGTVAFVRRQAYPGLALFTAVPILLVVVGMTATRQSAAVGLELLALAWLFDGRRRAAAAALGAAFLFHWSAAILLPLAVLANAPARWRRPLLFACAGLGGLAVVAIWFRGAGDASSAGALFRLAPTIVAAVIAGVALTGTRGSLQGADARLAALYLIGIAMFCLATWPASSLAADRFGYYTIALQMLAFPWLVARMENRRRRLAVAGMVGLAFFGLFVIWFSVSSHTRCMVPYRSYLQQPHLLIGWEGPRPLCA